MNLIFEPLRILLSVVFLAVPACFVGLAFGRWAGWNAPRPIRLPVAFLTGSALFSFFLLLLGLAGGFRPWTILALGLVALAVGLLCTGPLVPRPAAFGRPPWWALGILGAYGLLYFFHAWAPEASPDGMAYHVNLPRLYWEAGGVVPILTTIYAQMPQGMEMLFTFVYASGGPSAAAMVHLIFLAAWLPLIHFEAGRQGLGTKAWPVLVLVAATPVIGIDAASAYNDIALSACLFAVFVLMSMWRETPSNGLLMTASLLAGFCFSIKYTGALALLVLAGMAGRGLFTRAAILPASLMALPWLVKNAAFTGNPVAPFANRWFDNPVFDANLEAGYLDALRWTGTAKDLAAEILWRGDLAGGFLGPVFLLAPLALLAVIHKQARVWVLMAGLVGIPFAMNAGTRFLIPSLAFVCLALAAVIPARPLIALAVFHAILSWPAVADRYTPRWSWRIREIPVRAALRWEPERDYLARHVAGIRLVGILNRAQGRVLSLSQFHDSHTTARIVTATASRESRDLGEVLWRASTVERRGLQSRVRFWFPTADLLGFRLVTNHEPAGIARVAAYDLLTPVSARNWTSTASGNRHSAHRALDGSLLTQWHSATVPGDSVTFEVSFPEPTVMNRLDVDLASTEVLPPMRLDGRRAKDGAWITLRSGWDQVADPVPPADIRSEALDVLRENDIDYVLIQNSDHKHDIKPFDQAFETSRYRYEQAAGEGPARLYRIIRKAAALAGQPSRSGRTQ